MVPDQIGFSHGFPSCRHSGKRSFGSGELLNGHGFTLALTCLHGSIPLIHKLARFGMALRATATDFRKATKGFRPSTPLTRNL